MSKVWEVLAHYTKEIGNNSMTCSSTCFPMHSVFLEIESRQCQNDSKHIGGGHGGLLETEKSHKKSLKTAKPQEISSKSRIKLLTHKALVVFRISLSVLNFNTYKLILISEVFSGYFLVSAEHILA